MVFSHELFLPWMLITKFFPKPRNNQYVTFQIIPNVSSSFDPQKVSLSKNIVFSQIVSAETILFWKWKMWKFLYSFRIMAIFFFINWIVATETIQGGKLFKGGNYSRIYGMYFCNKICTNWTVEVCMQSCKPW